MNLLDEIINTAINIDQSLSVLLRQCLLLAHDTRNELLRDWANQELNGYHDESELPDYRVLKVGSYGTFSGYWGARIQGWPIPLSLLQTAHRDSAEH